MKTTLALSAAVLTAAIATAAPAQAQEAGDVQVKLLATMVDPDAGIDSIDINLVGAPAGTDTTADTNYVPTVAIEYFVSPNFSIETICCTTQHDVTGTGPLAGAELVSNALIVPATVTVKYHVAPGAAIRPYVGVGPAYFIYLNDDPGATAAALGATRTSLGSGLGFALQAGFDVPINDRGFGLSVDAKRYFVDTEARWFNAAGTEVLRTQHNLNPWVISAGVSYRF